MPTEAGTLSRREARPMPASASFMVPFLPTNVGNNFEARTGGRMKWW